MNGPRDQLRARPHLAGDQNGAICRRNTWHIHKRGQERLRRAKNVFVQLRADVLLKRQGLLPNAVRFPLLFARRSTAPPSQVSLSMPKIAYTEESCAVATGELIICLHGLIS